jgi:hypothetical protein
LKQEPTSSSREAGNIAAILSDIVGDIPNSSENATADPKVRARAIAKKAAMKAGTLSGMLAVPPGPLGLATIIPDLMGIWRLQRQMVADIAGAYGKTAQLHPTTMVYCLFKHGGAALTRDLAMRAGERFLIRQASVQSLQRVLNRIGVNVSQHLIAKTLSRFIPLVGALGLGAYAYYDTSQVAATAIELFSSDPEIDRASAAIEG